MVTDFASGQSRGVAAIPDHRNLAVETAADCKESIEERETQLCQGLGLFPREKSYPRGAGEAEKAAPDERLETDSL